MIQIPGEYKVNMTSVSTVVVIALGGLCLYVLYFILFKGLLTSTIAGSEHTGIPFTSTFMQQLGRC